MPTTYDAKTLEPVTSVAKIAVEDDIPVVTVQADRIPWYWWLTAGVVLGFFAAQLIEVRRR